MGWVLTLLQTCRQTPVAAVWVSCLPGHWARRQLVRSLHCPGKGEPVNPVGRIVPLMEHPLPFDDLESLHKNRGVPRSLGPSVSLTLSWKDKASFHHSRAREQPGWFTTGFYNPEPATSLLRGPWRRTSTSLPISLLVYLFLKEGCWNGILHKPPLSSHRSYIAAHLGRGRVVQTDSWGVGNASLGHNNLIYSFLGGIVPLL